MSTLPTTRAALVTRSDFQLLRAVYLIELQLIEHGVPAGALELASGLRSAVQRERLFAVAADPAFRPWQQQAAQAILGQSDPARDAVLRQADEHHVARRYRRAVQLYGWLLLCSREADNAMVWSARHLTTLKRQVYAPALQETSSC